MEGNLFGWDALVATDWRSLRHARGVADTTPRQLRNLVSAVVSERRAALHHLDDCVFHQGNIYSASRAAVRVIIGILDEAALLRAPDGETRDTSVLHALLFFLAAEGESLQDWLRENGAAVESFFATSYLPAPGGGWGPETILAAVTPLLSDPDEAVRRPAIDALTQWGGVQPGNPATQVVTARLWEHLTWADTRDERAAVVVALGRLGADMSALLDDADEAIRACAAMYVRTPQATVMLAEVLTHPAETDAWFTHGPPQFWGSNCSVILRSLIERGSTIESILPAALAMIAHATGGALPADREWGPVLQLTFPDAVYDTPGVCPPLPEAPTPTQRAVLETLVANTALWDPTNGNASLARKRVGVPDNPDIVRAYLAATRPTAPTSGG